MVDGTFALAQLCADVGVEKIIYASSASVYGMAETFLFRSATYTNADRTLYGVAKLFGEGIFRALATPRVALRYFNVYSSRMDIHGRYTSPGSVDGADRSQRSADRVRRWHADDGLIDVRDVARANVLAARSEIVDEVFNVASGIETSLVQLAAGLAAAMGRPQLGPTMQASRGTTAVERRVGDVEKARRLLGFVPEIGLQQEASRSGDLVARPARSWRS